MRDSAPSVEAVGTPGFLLSAHCPDEVNLELSALLPCLHGSEAPWQDLRLSRVSVLSVSQR